MTANPIAPKQSATLLAYSPRPICACVSPNCPRNKLTVLRQRAFMGLLVNNMRTSTKTATNRSTDLREQIEALRHMTVGQLKEEYREAAGRITNSFSFGESPGASKPTRWAAYPSGRAVAHSKSPTTQTCESGRPRAS
jgi:hypothetical protein